MGPLNTAKLHRLDLAERRTILQGLDDWAYLRCLRLIVTQIYSFKLILSREENWEHISVTFYFSPGRIVTDVNSLNLQSHFAEGFKNLLALLSWSTKSAKLKFNKLRWFHGHDVRDHYNQSLFWLYVDHCHVFETQFLQVLDFSQEMLESTIVNHYSAR